MPTIREQRLSFSFPPSFLLAKYEAWHHYRHVRQPLGEKAVDIVAFRRRNRPTPLWLIEVKDFRDLTGEPGAKNNRSNLPANVIQKAADTLSGLRDAALSAEVVDERAFAAEALQHSPNRVALNMEPFRGPSRLFPEQPARSNVLQKMKQLLKAHPELDPHPQVLSTANTKGARVPWTVAPV